MNEFMFIIRNATDAKAGLTTQVHLDFVNACKYYIEELSQNGQLISAQPMQREGVMISGTPGAFTEGPFHTGHHMIVGYYHIRAKDFAEAVQIAKANPEFAFHSNAKIEVRPIKIAEEANSFTYPKGNGLLDD